MYRCQACSDLWSPRVFSDQFPISLLPHPECSRHRDVIDSQVGEDIFKTAQPFVKRLMWLDVPERAVSVSIVLADAPRWMPPTPMIAGFGVRGKPEEASLVALVEAVERYSFLYANRVSWDRATEAQSVPLRLLWEFVNRDTASALTWSQLPGVRACRHPDTPDSTGMAAGLSFATAVRNGTRELVERALTARLLHGSRLVEPTRTFLPICAKPYLDSLAACGVRVRFGLLATVDGVHCAIAAATSSSDEPLAVGTGAGSSMSEALLAALREVTGFAVWSRIVSNSGWVTSKNHRLMDASDRILFKQVSNASAMVADLDEVPRCAAVLVGDVIVIERDSCLTQALEMKALQVCAAGPCTIP